MRLLAVALPLLVALLAAEGVLRLTRFASPIGLAYQTDSIQGHRLRPGYRGWFRNEGEAFFTVNSDGMPDREFAKTKAPNTFRVAVIGDSFTEAPGIPRAHRYTTILERALTGCAALNGKAVEVLAFGASAYGPAHELLEMRTHVWPYAPDLVLLQLFLPNDLRGSVRELTGGGQAPYFVRGPAGWELDSTSRRMSQRPELVRALESQAYRWLRTLHVVQAARLSRRSMSLPAATDTTFGFEAGADWQIFVPPPSAAWDQAWQTTEGLLGVMQAEAQQRGTRFMIAAFPSGIQVHPVIARREAFIARLGSNARLDYPEQRLAEIGTRLGIPILDLAPRMRTHAESTRTILYGFPNATLGLGHWNADGHRFGGETIAHWMCASLPR